MSNDMTKCPNCENCITDLRNEVARLKAKCKKLEEAYGLAYKAYYEFESMKADTMIVDAWSAHEEATHE